MPNPVNTQLADQLKELTEAGILKVKYPTGYKKWKAKFDYWFGITNDLSQTFDIIYGPGGGVKNYRGSLYRNANIKLPTDSKQKGKSK